MMGTDLVFTVKVTLPAASADEMRRDLDEEDCVWESTDEELIGDALTYFLGWHFQSVIETVE